MIPQEDFPRPNVRDINAKKLFLVGCPRSGTTLLQQALNRHSEIAIPPETKFFYYFYGMSHRWQLRHLERIRRDLAIEVSSPDARVRDDDGYRRVFDEIAARTLDQWNQPEVSYFGDKTPEHTARIPVLKRLYPQSKIVFVYRDPRAVVASLLEVPWIRCGPRSAASLWQRYARILVALKRQQAKGMHFVSYEQLVCRPADTLSDLCAFLGLQFEPEMAFGSGDQRVVPERELEWKSLSLSPISTQRVDRWRESLEPKQVVQIERIVGGAMQEIGYVPESSPPYQNSLLDWIPYAIELANMARSLTYQCLLTEARHVARRHCGAASLSPRADSSVGLR